MQRSDPISHSSGLFSFRLLQGKTSKAALSPEALNEGEMGTDHRIQQLLAHV